MSEFDDFARLARALAPWSDRLVFVGGWAHRLHRFHPKANVPRFAALLTRDTDIALDVKVPMKDDIKAALARQGFQEELRGDHRPPEASYTLGTENAGFYVEFLTPLAGSGRRRDGSPIANERRAVILAQRVRHLDILLIHPWQVTLDAEHGVPLPEPLNVLVAHPLCFMIQKFLIRESRHTQKKAAQDLLYIHDTIQMFGERLPEFKEAWKGTVAPALGKSGVAEVLKQCEASVSAVDDTLRNAARIPQDRKLDAEEMRLTCQLAFEHILFG